MTSGMTLVILKPGIDLNDALQGHDGKPPDKLGIWPSAMALLMVAHVQMGEVDTSGSSTMFNARSWVHADDGRSDYLHVLSICLYIGDLL